MQQFTGSWEKNDSLAVKLVTLFDKPANVTLALNAKTTNEIISKNTVNVTISANIVNVTISTNTAKVTLSDTE